MPKKHLEYSSGSSNKFWQIERSGKTQTVTYGRAGTEGRTITKEFDTLESAKASFEKLVKQKLSKGYVVPGKTASRRTTSGKGKATNQKKPARKSPPSTKRKSTKSSRKNAAQKSTGKSNEPFFKPLRASEKKYYVPLSADLVKQMEKRHGIKYPKSLIKLLRVQNGGPVLSPQFEFGRNSYELVEVPPIRDDGGLEPLTAGYPDHVEAVEGRLKDPHLIFPLFGDGHYFIALDYRDRGPKQEPTVVYLDIEDRPWHKKIANTFADFLAGQCRPKQRPRVRVELADPDCQIGYAERNYVITDRLTAKPMQVEERHWLFLTDTHVECFAYQSSRKRVGKDKFSKDPDSESWERNSTELKDITSVKITTWNALWTRRKVLDVKTSPAKMGVYYDLSERVKGKGWKNTRGGPIIYFYFHGMPKNLTECKAKITAAIKGS